MRLDLACGNNKQEGFTGIDITKEGTQADIALNLLSFPWSFEENSVDEIFCSHFIEHIPHGDGFNDPFFDFFNEVGRILRVGGKAIFTTPYYTSMRAFQDPTHQRFITEATYAYLDQEWRKNNKLEHYPIKTDLKVVSCDYFYSGKPEDLSNEDRQFGLKHFWNVSADMRVVIQK